METALSTLYPGTDENKFIFDSKQTGLDIVQAVISKLCFLQILSCDNHLLERIALVETENGTTCVPDGGIWALDENKFNLVANKVKEILSSKLCLTITNGIHYALLRQPLVSGLAAGLYLNFLENNANIRIPFDESIQEQAQFWIKYYHSTGSSVDYFVRQVERREGMFMMLMFLQWPL